MSAVTWCRYSYFLTSFVVPPPLIFATELKVFPSKPAYADEKELTIGNLLKLPFTKIRELKKSERIDDDKCNELKP